MAREFWEGPAQTAVRIIRDKLSGGAPGIDRGFFQKSWPRQLLYLFPSKALLTCFQCVTESFHL